MKYISILTFLISTTFLLPISMALITCDKCETDNCTCHISDCKSGILDVFVTTDCSGAPSYEFVFSNSEIVWSPAETYSYYLTAFCDDSTTKSVCSDIAVKQGTTTSTTTTTTTTQITTTTTKNQTTTTTSIPIYGPSKESAFGIAVRVIAIISVIALISIWVYSRL